MLGKCGECVGTCGESARNCEQVWVSVEKCADNVVKVKGKCGESVGIYYERVGK